ncbi:hypothetical protein D8O27_06075 [Burkholderia mallei]|nr:hypothetical protein BOC35_30500 [Burkholderia pseudomallei]RKO02531.1 hypothetical protein D8O31_02525 [Burkholderia mallei]ARK52777.1 hypothetical protein BOC36_06180 [Burkholderia pseudomallei]ARK67932.1 hypothetical protein BOC38_15250 [Burkholderia pseudomallei]ARK77232.1 hypothetical protein BOC39_27990 [Burkholderia pseudomallei]
MRILVLILFWRSTETITSLSSEQMVLIYPTHHSIGSDIIDHKTVNINGASCKYFVPAKKLIIE